jgi:hypothetical protein
VEIKNSVCFVVSLMKQMEEKDGGERIRSKCRLMIKGVKYRYVCMWVDLHQRR